MKKVEYSQIVIRKIKRLRENLTRRFGKEVSQKAISKMSTAVRTLELYENRGVCISKIFDIDCDYRYIYVEHNYLFYRVESDKIIIVEMFDSREDFMFKLFGIEMTSENVLDDWKE